MRVVFLHIIIICLTNLVFSQDGLTSLSKRSILIGEPVTVIYSIEIPSGATFKYVPHDLFLPGKLIEKEDQTSTTYSESIELLEPFRDTVIQENNKKVWHGTYQITAWDSGVFVVDRNSILINGKEVPFPSFQLEVNLIPHKKGQDIYDIREAFTDVPAEPLSIQKIAKNYWWILLLVLLGLVFWQIYKRRKNRKDLSKQPKDFTLKEKTLLAIDQLEAQKLWEKNKLKQHYVELSFILRSYLSDRYTLNFLERTTKETELLLANQGLSQKTIQQVISVLIQSDMVKFAKSKPEEQIILQITQLARIIVEETSLTPMINV